MFLLIFLTIPPAFAQIEYELLDRPITALGFGNFDYAETDIGLDGFMIGQLVGQLNAVIDNNFTFFTEMTASAVRDEDFEFEVERIFVRYDFSDLIKLAAGRYHTPIGYWNTAYHHGAWLQTTISRPEVVRFGSSIIPIHFDGILLEGMFLKSNVGYRGGFGNGRFESINDPGDTGDINSDRAWLATIYYRPPTGRRLETGVSVYSDRATPAIGPEVDETIFNAYFALQSETPEIISEYYYSQHERTNTAGANGDTESFYAQIAYRLPGFEKFKPYARYENTDVDADDPLLGGLGLNFERLLVGVRWDFSYYAALKGEFRSEDREGVNDVDSFWLQIAFVIGGGETTYAAQ